VLWRQKEQFSDGVGYDWVDGLMKHAEDMVTDEMFAARAERFPPRPEVRALRNDPPKSFTTQGCRDIVT